MFVLHISFCGETIIIVGDCVTKEGSPKLVKDASGSDGVGTVGSGIGEDKAVEAEDEVKGTDFCC